MADWKTMVEDPMEEYRKKQNQQYNQTVSNINTAIDNQKAAAQQNAKNQLTAADAKYRRQYDANAIQEVIDRNALNERMANRGLTNSGLNDTQQTAIALARGNRDAAVTRSQNQFIADTDLALQEIYNKAEADRAAKTLAAGAERDANIQNAQLGYTKAYNDMVKEKAKQANELKLAQYKALISAGRYDEANALLGGANGTVGQTAQSELPYSRHLYRKVDNTINWWWGTDGDDVFFDENTGEYLTGDEIITKLSDEGKTQIDKDYFLRNLSNIGEGEYYSGVSGIDPGDFEHNYEDERNWANNILDGLLTQEAQSKIYSDIGEYQQNYAINQILRMYPTNKEAAKQLMLNIGVDPDEVNGIIAQQYGSGE